MNIDNDWFYIPKKHANVHSKLFCFHLAGSNANFFENWARMLPQEVQLMAMQLPGRPPRDSEASIFNMNELILQLVEALLPLLDKPYALLGHSMGAVISYELLRVLYQRNVLPPSCLIVSACSAPSSLVTPKLLDTSKHVKNFGESFQSDAALLRSWNYQSGEKFNIPFVICGGIYDLFVPCARLIEWQAHTEAEFSIHLYKGGHNYIEYYVDKVIGMFLPYLIPK